jgi:hypothetical protein
LGEAPLTLLHNTPLEAWGWSTEQIDGDIALPLSVWAQFSAFTGSPLLLMTDNYAAIARDGRVYDTIRSGGAEGCNHPQSRADVVAAFRVRRIGRS